MKTIIALLALLFINERFLVIKASENNQSNVDIAVHGENYTNFVSNFVLGQPTNDICLAILKSTKPSAFICLYYVGRTNSNRFWMAPPRFQRAEYYLYDSSGKVMPYLAAYHPDNKAYKSISDAAKNAHSVYEGLMAPPFTMPYDQIALTNVFQVQHSGDYKLIVKGRIMKINDDSSLSILEIPPVSLLIHFREEDVPHGPN